MNEAELKKQLSEIIVKRMTELNINATTLAKMINTDKSNVSCWINQKKLLKITIVNDLCRALQIDPNTLLNFTIED